MIILKLFFMLFFIFPTNVKMNGINVFFYEINTDIYRTDVIEHYKKSIVVVHKENLLNIDFVLHCHKIIQIIFFLFVLFKL